jgi:hypothetical protein
MPCCCCTVQGAPPLVPKYVRGGDLVALQKLPCIQLGIHTLLSSVFFLPLTPGHGGPRQGRAGADRPPRGAPAPRRRAVRRPVGPGPRGHGARGGSGVRGARLLQGDGARRAGGAGARGGGRGGAVLRAAAGGEGGGGGAARVRQQAHRRERRPRLDRVPPPWPRRGPLRRLVLDIAVRLLHVVHRAA